MQMERTLDLIKKYGTCSVCGDATVGNGSKLIIEDSSFCRTCRECGWEVKGIIDAFGNFSETTNNASLLMAKA